MHIRTLGIAGHDPGQRRSGAVGCASSSEQEQTAASVERAALGDALPGTNATTFAAAKADFNATENAAEGLGPIFNAQACAQCHQNGANSGAGQHSLRQAHQRPLRRPGELDARWGRSQRLCNSGCGQHRTPFRPSACLAPQRIVGREPISVGTPDRARLGGTPGTGTPADRTAWHPLTPFSAAGDHGLSHGGSDPRGGR